jgi:hypothetical protein
MCVAISLHDGMKIVAKEHNIYRRAGNLKYSISGVSGILINFMMRVKGQKRLDMQGMIKRWV